MIMPTKVIQPVDSLISISSVVLEVLNQDSKTIDNLLEEVNARYYKKISIEKLILCMDFLFIVDKVKSDNDIITISI